VQALSDVAAVLWHGLAVTLQVTAAAAVLAAVVSFAAGLAGGSRFRAIRWSALVYVETFRGTSALVQLFWFYFVLPFFGIELDAMTAGVVALGLNAGAYGAEIVRGAIRAVPRGQRDAAAALNFDAWQTLRHVLMPQALLAMLPPFGNLTIELLKNSALVSLIAITELTFAAQVARSATLDSAQIFSAVLLLYFVTALCITWLYRSFERMLRKRGAA